MWENVVYEVQCSQCSGNLQGNLLRGSNVGNLLLLCDRYRKPAIFLVINNAKSSVGRAVNYTWTNTWLSYGKQFSRLFGIYSKLGQFPGKICLSLFHPTEHLACFGKGNCLLTLPIGNKHYTQQENSELIKQKKNMLIQVYAHDLCKCTAESSGEQYCNYRTSGTENSSYCGVSFHPNCLISVINNFQELSSTRFFRQLYCSMVIIFFSKFKNK